MRPIHAYRRRYFASYWLGLLLILLLAFGGTLGLLLLLGVNLNPFAATRDDPFMVRIPINSRAIPAYERVAREDLLNAATGGLMYQRIPPLSTVGMSVSGTTADGALVDGRVRDVRNVDDEVVFVLTDGRELPHSSTLELGGALMNANSIIGRVVKKDKRPGMGFREETFFPQGTPEGIAGATPPGMRAVTLDATKIGGVYSLNAGDRIDLMASVPVSELSSYSSSYQAVSSSALVVSTTSKQEATEALLIAQHAVVLKPVYVRSEATTSSSLTQGKRVQNVPKYEVVIAVAPDDVVPLQNALDKSVAITCIAHSMQSSTATSEPPPTTANGEQQLVPVTVRAIMAYDVVNREAFVNPATRRLRLEVVTRQQIDRLGIITSLEDALGMIARHDIPAGRYLRRADLLSENVMPRNSYEPSNRHGTESAAEYSTSNMRDPGLQFVSNRAAVVAARQADPMNESPSVVGDRPAVTRFVPPGYSAFAIPWNRLYGAEHLQIGDAIDLLASYSLENRSELEETETRPDGTQILRRRHDVETRTTMRTWDESFGMRGEPWFVASDALVVGPVGFPPPAAAQRALGESVHRQSSSGSAAGFTGPPLIIAVDDRDVESVAAALATEQVLFSVAFHSALQDEYNMDRMKRIAMAAQDIAAYDELTETVWHGNRRRPLSRVVPLDDARHAAALTIAEMDEYQHRVLRRAKRRGEFFTASDFLPPGSGPGVAAAVGPGAVIFAVADREIEGLDVFKSDDTVAILIRTIVRAPEGVIVHGVDLERPQSRVVVPAARIVRESRAGQTILEIANQDVTRLQAAWAESMTAADESAVAQRSRLVAVALSRVSAQETSGQELDRGAPRADSNSTSHRAQDSIPAFDPVGGLIFMESIIGQRREIHAFPALAADALSTDLRSPKPLPTEPLPTEPLPTDGPSVDPLESL